MIKQKSGAALLTVLVALMVISIMLFEFQYSSMLERKLAYNELNQLQAYYLAKAGARIGLLRVALFGRARRSPDLKKVAQGINISPYLELIWSLPLPAFPPDATKVKDLIKSDRDAAEKALEQTKIIDGQFTNVISSESSKINLNFLVVPAPLRNQRINFRDRGQQGLFKYVGLTLIQLLENFLRESENPFEEYGNLRPEDVVFDIMDWVNPGNESMRGGAKDSFYENLKPSYKAKKNRFYTVDELKLVRGIDDHLFTKLRPYITVYSYDGKININSASSDVIRAIYPDFTEDDLKRIMEERTRVGQWTSENEFVTFITDTLGRSGFKSFYSDENNYPFTVTSQSFLIESMGIIKKSGSQVQKIIRIGVALTTSKGGGILPAKTPEECTQLNGFIHPVDNQCRPIPKTPDECKDLYAGTPDANNCCVIPQMKSKPLCPNAKAAKGSVEPNALKILSWSEI